MSSPKNFSELNNKVYLRGQIINTPRKSIKKEIGGYVISFVLAVKRDNLTLTYNSDKLNYFLCTINEKLTCGQFIAEAYHNLKENDYVEVYGILDSLPRFEKRNRTNQINYRAHYGYTSSVNIVKWNKIQGLTKERTEVDNLARKARNIFGTEYDVQFAEHAFDYDADGLPYVEDISDI